uniref:Innexin n=1 Tax=Acrobeloides nanus TaxID=290746 RepID=A0A914CXU4_9BILA
MNGKLKKALTPLLKDGIGINFNNVVNASQSVQADNDGVSEVDEEKLYERVPVIADNFRCASSSNAFAAFIAFEAMLVIAPLVLLFFVLPIMVGGSYRTWGLDVARAWWERKEWQGSPLIPFFGSEKDDPIMPLIPRITYCDYHFVTLGNDHVLTYRCYLDANWHERTALFTWIMLVFLTFINLCNLWFWVGWAIRMRNRRKRQKWVIKKWLNNEDYGPNEKEFVERFAAQFKMGNLLLFYYIEAHTDRVVASAFANALYTNWLEKQQQQIQNSFIVNISKATAPPPTPEAEKLLQQEGKDIGWDSQPKEIGIGWSTNSDAGIQELPQRQTPYPETPASMATGFSSASTSQLVDTPRRSPPRSRTPPPKRGFYRPNITKSPIPQEMEPLSSTSKIKEKRKSDKKKKDEDGDNQRMRYRCAIM